MICSQSIVLTLPSGWADYAPVHRWGRISSAECAESTVLYNVHIFWLIKWLIIFGITPSSHFAPILAADLSKLIALDLVHIKAIIHHAANSARGHNSNRKLVLCYPICDSHGLLSFAESLRIWKKETKKLILPIRKNAISSLNHHVNLYRIVSTQFPKVATFFAYKMFFLYISCP